ncbi:Cerato-platanin [Guyanagaster necrorhizus]|uniref:Cerato-platanin n=1 Tax=Guyanagaster necrorhizus TaxID=856835 RepID=A0A9P7VZS1_9AGAR|nr:Cerato-platanin [Guyanagaster necrorhizus MCA 3950]KAG7449547.1 Cerato-platanin [Guyanagaster necrorhizus MCA 3950]
MTMKFFSTLVLVQFIPSYTLAVTVGYGSGYGIGSNSLANDAFSDGSNGLLTKLYTTYSSVPNSPYIASSDSITGWNSLSYNGRTINVLAIDHAALNDLANRHAIEYGSGQAAATQANTSTCGL